VDADEVVQQYAAAWGRGDPEAAFQLYADDVVMRLPGRSDLAGVHQGIAAVVAAIKALLARTDGTAVEVEVVDRMRSDTEVALVLREVVQRDDERLELGVSTSTASSTARLPPSTSSRRTSTTSTSSSAEDVRDRGAAATAPVRHGSARASHREPNVGARVDRAAAVPERASRPT
jgi:uncharacterized protein (TIGR02246 family)